MKPFDPTAICPACHHDVISSQWMPERILPGYVTDWSVVFPSIDRTCTRCGYKWPEVPLNPEMSHRRCYSVTFEPKPGEQEAEKSE